MQVDNHVAKDQSRTVDYTDWYCLAGINATQRVHAQLFIKNLVYSIMCYLNKQEYKYIFYT